MYRNLAIKGGGTKIFFSTGAITALEEGGILSGIERVSGASAGSFLALAVALKMDSEQIRDTLLGFDFTEEVKNYDPKKETERFFAEYGRYSGEYIIDQAKNIISKYLDTPDATFAKMHKMGFKDLYITATDLTNQKSVVFSYEDTPNAKVADAIRASCAYPLYFTPIKGQSGELLADGGLMDNYPIRIFDQEKYLPDKNLEYNPETLGIFLGSKQDAGALNADFSRFADVSKHFNGMDPELICNYLKSLDYHNFDNENQIKDVASYIKAVFSACCNAKPYTHHPEGEIFLDTNFKDSKGNVLNILDMDLDAQTKAEIMENGHNQALEWILHNELTTLENLQSVYLLDKSFF